MLQVFHSSCMCGAKHRCHYTDLAPLAVKYIYITCTYRTVFIAKPIIFNKLAVGKVV